jgi:hypothetical protein
MLIFSHHLLMLLSQYICITRLAHRNIFIVIKREKFLRLIIIVLLIIKHVLMLIIEMMVHHLYLCEFWIIIIIHSTISHVISICHHHMILVIIFLRKTRSIWKVIVLFTNVVIGLTESIRTSIMHLIYS